MPSNRNEVGSLAGTWVAAGVALIGIFAIVGPLLVWRASRTARHKALMKIGRNNNGYLSDGIPVWPGIRFLRRERVPILKTARPFHNDEWVSLNRSLVKSFPDSTATWVQFGACLEAYGVKVSRGRGLILDTGAPQMPVHKSYLFTMLVMGRFQKRERSKNIPTQFGVQPHMSIVIDIPTQPPVYDEDKGPPLFLHGLTGSMKFDTLPSSVPSGNYYVIPPATSSVNGHVHFFQQLPDHLEQDGLPPSATMSLALGFISLPSGEHLYLSNPPQADDDRDSGLHQVHHRDLGRVAELEAEANMRKLEVEVYMLDSIPLDSSRSLWKTTGLPTQALALRRLDVPAPDQGLLQEVAPMTYIPPEYEYVRIYPSMSEPPDTHPFSPISQQAYMVPPDTHPFSPISQQAYMVDNREEAADGQHGAWGFVFMTRQSAQVLALALLSLQWSRKSYVIGRIAKSSIVLGLLLQASPAALLFLLRLKKHPAILQLGLADSTELLAAVDQILQSGCSIADLCALDDVLADLQHPMKEVSLMISVLFITNVEIRALVYQAMRHTHSHAVANARAIETELDFDTGHVTIIGAFGVSHVFVVDLDHLLGNLPGHQRSQTRIVKVNFAVVLLAAMKAFTRSLMLMQRIDAVDIETAMGFEGDEYLMS